MERSDWSARKMRLHFRECFQRYTRRCLTRDDFNRAVPQEIPCATSKLRASLTLDELIKPSDRPGDFTERHLSGRKLEIPIHGTRPLTVNHWPVRSIHISHYRCTRSVQASRWPESPLNPSNRHQPAKYRFHYIRGGISRRQAKEY